MKNHKKALLLSVLLTAGAHAASAADPPTPDDKSAEPVDVQVFEGARPLTWPGERAYPPREQWNGGEGWVVMNMMIDPRGKPHDVTVLDSTANPAFEEAALKAVDLMTFQPAKSGQTPIDSSLTLKIVFTNDNFGREASPEFVSRFTRVQKAVDAGDRAGADAQLPKLEARNLYENAFKSLAQYLYDHRWGSVEDQLKDLQHAIASEGSAVYLPSGTFSRLLAAEFTLQAQSNDLGTALTTWKNLSRISRSPLVHQLQPLADRILAVQKSTQEVSLRAKIGPGPSWNGCLFRNRFSISVANGAVSEIKLRCKKRYVSFKYQPNTQYTLNSGAGDCGIEIIGDPGTAFEITQ